MGADVQIFSNQDFGQIRTVEVNGEPWLVGKDVAAALGYGDTAQAIRKTGSYTVGNVTLPEIPRDYPSALRALADEKGVSQMATPFSYIFCQRQMP